MPKEAKKVEEPAAAAWLLTYGDMVTLVLTFFVLLVSMMVVDPKKFVEVLGTFKDAGGEAQNIVQEIEPVPKEDYFIQIIKAATRRTTRPDGGEIVAMDGEAVRVYAHRENYVVQLGKTSFFREFEVVLTEQGKDALKKVAEIIRTTGLNRVKLTGHYAPSESPARFAALAQSRVLEDEFEIPYSYAVLQRRTQLYNPATGQLDNVGLILNSEQDLAIHRARAVRDFLIREGVGAELMEMADGGQLGSTLKAVKTVDVSMKTGHFAESGETANVREGSAEAGSSLVPAQSDGLAYRTWPSFIFTEGGVDEGRTVSITVTGEVVAKDRRFIQPLSQGK